jgi:xylan 1,4-beta-xylosidase
MLLHKLGDERLEAPVDAALVTRRKDGTLVMATWNLVEPGAQGADKTVTFDVYGAGGLRAEVKHKVEVEIKNTKAVIWRVDAAHGDTLAAWKKMGSPAFPTEEQIQDLREAADVGAPEEMPIRDHRLTVTVPPMGLVVVEVQGAGSRE